MYARECGHSRRMQVGLSIMRLPSLFRAGLFTGHLVAQIEVVDVVVKESVSLVKGRGRLGPFIECCARGSLTH